MESRAAKIVDLSLDPRREEFFFRIREWRSISAWRDESFPGISTGECFEGSKRKPHKCRGKVNEA